MSIRTIHYATCVLVVGLLVWLGFMASEFDRPSLDTPKIHDALTPVGAGATGPAVRATMGSGEVPLDNGRAGDVTRWPSPQDLSVAGSSGPPKSEQWIAIAKLDFEVAKQFAAGSAGVTWQRLCRNATLNPQDIEFTLQQRLELESLVARYLRLVADSLDEHCRKQMMILQDLREKALLTELTIDLVPASERQEFMDMARVRYAVSHGLVVDPKKLSVLDLNIPQEKEAAAVRAELWRRARDFLPDAREILLHGNRVYVATEIQMVDAAETRAFVYFVRRDFLMATLGWFVSNGFVDVQSIAHVIERFDELMAREQY